MKFYIEYAYSLGAPKIIDEPEFMTKVILEKL